MSDAGSICLKIETRRVRPAIRNTDGTSDISAAEKGAAKAGIQQVRALCDSVRQEDGMGFSKVTGRIGHSLAAVAGDYTDGQVFLAKKICTIHRRQINADTLAVLGIEEK